MLGRIVTWATAVVWLRRQWSASSWLRPLALGALFVGIIAIAHQEYLSYAEAANETQGVFISFVVKWGLIATTAITVILVGLRNRSQKRHRDHPHSSTNASEPPIRTPDNVDFSNPRSAAERILNEPPR